MECDATPSGHVQSSQGDGVSKDFTGGPSSWYVSALQRTIAFFGLVLFHSIVFSSSVLQSIYYACIENLSLSCVPTSTHICEWYNQ